MTPKLLIQVSLRRSERAAGVRWRAAGPHLVRYKGEASSAATDDAAAATSTGSRALDAIAASARRRGVQEEPTNKPNKVKRITYGRGYGGLSEGNRSGITDGNS